MKSIETGGKSQKQIGLWQYNQEMKLISYIAPGAPATRRRAEGNEPFFRIEIGFTPQWYSQHLDIDFGFIFHNDPAYRRDAIIAMRDLLEGKFPGIPIGGNHAPSPLDLLTGTFGVCLVAGIYGIPILYSSQGWPICESEYLTEQEIDQLEPPDLDTNQAFQGLLQQVDWIARREGKTIGFINWQGVLNNAHRLWGERLFFDLIDNPAICEKIFDCLTTTMIEATQILHERQGESGFEPGFSTISNCLVNLISPGQYKKFLLKHDQRIAEAFGCIGIHNCAWDATFLFDSYRRVSGIGYIDMGIETDMPMARKLFPEARRALMYNPRELQEKSTVEIESDFQKIALELGPCDLVLADIDAKTPDSKVKEVFQIAEKISSRNQEHSRSFP